MSDAFAGPGTDSAEEDSGGTLLSAIAADIKAHQDSKFVTFEVPGRPGFAVRYRAHIEHRRLQLLQSRSKDKSVIGFDDTKLGCLVLSTLCDAVLKDEKVIYDAEQKPVTFSSPELWDLLGVMEVTEAVRRFYGSDATIIQLSYEVLQACGYGDEVRQVDPTGRPSSSD